MDRRLGGQEPTFKKVGGWSSTRGPEAVGVFEAYGRRYYGSQKLEMEIFFARDADGEFAAKSIGITKPRQNGKSFAVRDYCLWMAIVEHKSVLYSAHHGRTVRKMFKEMCDFIESHEDFRDELESIYKAGGYEGIYFKDGTCIEFQTRTNAGGRGGTYNVIVFDEAQELTSAQQDAILPTVSAAGEIDEGESDPQKIYIGTVPGPLCQGTVFREMHDRVHSGDSSIWWLEWGAVGESIDDVDIDDIDLWYACNPAMGRRMSESTVRDEHDTMSRDGFARERLGWWDAVADTIHPISFNDWQACRVDDAPEGEPLAYAAKFSPDGLVGSIAVCTDGEPPFVEVVANRSMRHGVGWFARWIADRADRVEAVVIDGKSNAQTLADKLEELGVDEDKVVRPSTADVIAANTAFVDATRERAVCHAGQPALVDSATLSGFRKIGNDGGFGFLSNDKADATLAEACALAYWCALSIRRNPRQELRIG